MTPLRSAFLTALLGGSAMRPEEARALSGPGALERLSAELRDDPAELGPALAARAELLLSAPAGQAWELARETLDLVVPIADSLGCGEARAELEEASFRALDPAAWAALDAHPRVRRAPALLDRMLADLGEVAAGFAEAGVAVSGRVKSRYGLHEKMARKGVGLDGIDDLVATRLVVADALGEPAIYGLLDAVLARWPAVPGALDDYVAAPKPNGYRSLHAVVRAGEAGDPVEVQIRTAAMHAAAESGPAAHWRYKVAARRA